MPAAMPRRTTWSSLAITLVLATGCDREEKASTPPITVPTAPPAAPAPEAPAAPPEIILDVNHVAVGKQQVPTADPGLTARVASLLAVPGVEGSAVDVVAMRDVKPSRVQAVLAALRGAKAT